MSFSDNGSRIAEVTGLPQAPGPFDDQRPPQITQRHHPMMLNRRAYFAKDAEAMVRKQLTCPRCDDVVAGTAGLLKSHIGELI
ncbi:MAG: hypothetical protein M3300_04170 [Actinomycetota bacterium]|nr:hypothetical protein [Actinomycetota bacterium]